MVQIYIKAFSLALTKLARNHSRKLKSNKISVSSRNQKTQEI